MKLKHARLCLDCENIYAGERPCPDCGGGLFSWVNMWLPSILEPAIEAAPEPVGPAPALKAETSRLAGVPLLGRVVQWAVG